LGQAFSRPKDVARRLAKRHVWSVVADRAYSLGDLLGHDDEEKSDRVMGAMLQMDKLDIARLPQAYEGA
jgi:hypothetical protein